VFFISDFFLVKLYFFSSPAFFTFWSISSRINIIILFSSPSDFKKILYTSSVGSPVGGISLPNSLAS